jgi:serine/threonine protein kinase
MLSCYISLDRKKYNLQTFSFLRNHHVIHGDLKPDNIGFLRVGPRRWRIRVFDFGLAQYAIEGSELRIQTLNYRSPEVVLGICPYHDAIDMWSTGCVLWEMKLGRPLFQCSYVHQLVQQFIDVLGHPPEWMLDAGTQTYSFFRRFRRHSSSFSKYVLNTSSQYPSASSRRSLQPQLCCTCRSQGDLEHLDCVTFCDLVSRLVCYDPHKRLLPKDILAHPFMLLQDHRYCTTRLPKRRVSLSDFRLGSSSPSTRCSTTTIRATTRHKHGKRHKRSSSSESRDS